MKAVNQVQRGDARRPGCTCYLAVKPLGALDIVVNAIDAPFYAPAEAIDDNAFDRVIENNLKTGGSSPVLGEKESNLRRVLHHGHS